MLNQALAAVTIGWRRAGEWISRLTGRGPTAPPPVAARPAPPRLTTKASPAAMPATPVRPASPLPSRSSATPSAPPRGRAPSERVRRLRRAATFDLFRACGLGPPPRCLWPFVDDDHDVGAGVDRFLRAVGHTGRGAAAAMADLLRAETDLRTMPVAQADALRREITCGDPVRSAAAVRTVRNRSAAATARIRSASPTTDDLAEEHRRLRRELAANWPEDWIVAAAGERVRALLDRYEEAETELLAAPTGGEGGILATKARLNDELAGLAHVAAQGGPPPDPDALAPLSDEAAELDPRLAASPNRDAALELWAEFRWRHHPDRPGLNAAARAAAERASAAADRALDRWERSAGFGGGPAQP